MAQQAPAAATVADTIRRQILAGHLAPGTRLDEASLVGVHGVSRNTLREAFRLLAHDRLVEHHPHRGVFVRTIGAAEAHDLYRVRRLVAVGVVRAAAERSAEERAPALARMEEAVTAAELASTAGDWDTVGTCNAEFHLALVSIGGNRVADRLMGTVIAELRLVFLSADTAAHVHPRYLEGNRSLLELVRTGDLARTADALDLYLRDAEDHVLATLDEA